MRIEKSLIVLVLLNVLIWTVSPFPGVLHISSQSLPAAAGQSLPSSGVAWAPDGSRLAAIGGTIGDTILLWDSAHNLVGTLTGHQGWLNGIAWSPDSKYLAAAGQDKLVWLWSRDGQLIQRFTGHTGSITSLMWSPDGTTLATAASNDDGTIRLWSIDGQVLRVMTGGPTHIDGGTSVYWSPTGDKILALYGDNKAQVWDTNGNVLATIVDRHDGVETGNINRLIWAPDGEKIAAATVNKGIEIFKTDGTLIQTLPSDASNAEIAWSADGKYLAASAFDHTLKLWNAETGKQIGIFDDASSYITSIAMSPDASLVAFASSDKVGTVHIWNMKAQEVAVISANTPVMGAVELDWSPDSQVLVGRLGNEAILTLWDRAGKPITTLVDPLLPEKPKPAALPSSPDGHTDTVTNVTWSTDGKLATTGLDRTVRVWDTDGKLIAKINEKKVDTALAWSPDGTMLATGGMDHYLRLYDAQGKLIQTFASPTAGNFLMDIRWLKGGKTLATMSNTVAVQLWDMTTGDLSGNFPTSSTMIMPEWSSDNDKLAFVTDAPQSYFSLGDTKGNIVTQFPNEWGGLSRMAWSPDATKLVFVSTDHADIVGLDGKKIATIMGSNKSLSNSMPPGNGFPYVAWAPDGKALALAWVPMLPSNDGQPTLSPTEVVIVDDRGQQIASLVLSKTRQLVSMVWSPDGKTLATSTYADGITLFDLASKVETVFKAEDGNVVSGELPWLTVWSPDGKLLATGSDTSGTIQLWKPNGQLAASLKAPEGIGAVTYPGIQWSPDGQRIVARYGDGNTVLMWDTAGNLLINLVKP